jgi:hypothetical protein
MEDKHNTASSLSLRKTKEQTQRESNISSEGKANQKIIPPPSLFSVN